MNLSKHKNTHNHDLETELDNDQFAKEVGADAKRKLAAKKRKNSSWFGLGMFGLIGWSISIPTVLGIAVGLYIDRHFSDDIPWVITGLMIGIFIGCLNAWYWLQQEGKND